MVVQMAKQQKREGLSGLLPARTSTYPVQCQQHTADGLAKSPTTQPACVDRLTHPHKLASERTALNGFEHLKDTAMSSEVDTTRQAMVNPGGTLAAPLAGDQSMATPRSNSQASSSDNTSDVTMQPAHEQGGQCIDERPAKGQKVKGTEKLPRPSSWQRRKAAKLRQTQHDLQGAAAQDSHGTMLPEFTTRVLNVMWVAIVTVLPA